MLYHPSTKVNFFSEGLNPGLKNRSELKKFIELIFKKEKTNLQSINYVFCTDKKLRKINKKYLKHDFLTDIISFDLSEKREHIVSEVYISVERVKDNAKVLMVGYSLELHRVIFHGALHLCGYSDKSEKEKKLMRKREDFYLYKYFN